MYIHLDIHFDVHFAIQTIGTNNFGISRFTSIFVILNCQTHDPLLYSHLIKFNNFPSFITINEVPALRLKTVLSHRERVENIRPVD